MKKIQICFDDRYVEVRGELMFDPQEGTIHVFGAAGQATFNWDRINYFIVKPYDEDDEEEEE